MAESFPRSFGKYTLLEHLAQGGMGSLYLACQGEPGMEKLCVVKTVLRELADKEYVARFRDEAKVVVRLSHGNLVPVFDAGTVEGELYIAMDYVDGRDLRAVWNQCAKKGIAFPVDVAVYLAKELARGLHHAHTAGDLKLVHRDVSPPNVLLAWSGEVKLTDFGLAASTLKLEHTAPGVIYGKVSYMAPEQARGETLDGRADLYAAGVILWELLTGRQLFPNTDGDALARVRSPQIMPPSSRASRVSALLDGIVMKALAVERDERYPDGEAFRAALAGFLAREAPTTDTARVAGFLRDLFGDEIERDRQRRESLIEQARKYRADLQPTVLASSPVFAGRSAPPDAPPAPGAATPSPASARSGPSNRGALVEVAAGLEDDDDEDDRRSAGVLGTTLDSRYRVIRLIGEGGMGRVYEGEHIEIGKRVAIKVLHPRYSEMPEVVARFRREARAASRIGHPNIVDVTDFGTTESGSVYFVMEFLEGSDLADVIEREKVLGLDRSIHIAIQLSRALEAAHAANVIHRDLKPENIFLVARPTQPDFVKVLDFGIARHLELERGKRLTRPDMAMGTPEYMAPEQAAGKPTDARADVYATGAILYEMLTGASPHNGDNAMEILHKKANEIPTPVIELRPDVSRALSDLIDKALARDPAKRHQTMSELTRDLERCRPDRRGQARKKRRFGLALATATAPARAAVAGASLLLVGLIAAVAWRHGVRTPAPGSVAAAERPVAAGADSPAPVAAEPESPVARPAPRPAAPPAPAPAAVARAEKPVPVKPERSALSTHSEKASGSARSLSPANARDRSVATAVAKHAPAPSLPRIPTTPAEARRQLDEGNRLLRDHQYAQAERIFRRVYDASKGPAERAMAATGIGRVAFESGHYQDAVRESEHAVRIGGGVPAHMVLGDAYFKVQRYGEAAREYREVLKKKPGHADAQRRLNAALQRAAGG